MSTSTQKAKANKSVRKRPSQSTSTSWNGLAGFSSDEEPSVDLSNPPQTPASKSLNPGILPNSSPTRPSDFLDSDVFDYDRIKRAASVADNDENDLELWIVRVPLGVKPKALEKLQLDLEAFPSASSSSTQAKVGSLPRKNTSYDAWSISAYSPSKRPREGKDNEFDAHTMVGGEEILGMQCLLPRKRDGKLYLAPPMKTKHLVLCQKPALPTPPSSASGSPTANNGEETLDGRTFTSTPRFSHPAHLLKHRFLPTGTLSNLKESTSRQDVDDMMADTSNKRHEVEGATTSRSVKTELESTPKKKRKADGKDGKEDKKKTKKAKTGT